MALFLDVYNLSTDQTNSTLEFIFKSQHSNDDGIWKPHESPLLRRLVELFTQRGLSRLDHVKQQIIAWESGANYRDHTKPIARPGMMERWGKDELSLVKLYLESLPPLQWTLDDHMLALEYTIQRYLPLYELRTEAEWLATKANLMGKVQANMDKQPTLEQADTILEALPSTVGAAVEMFSFTPAQQATLDFGAAKCVENVRALTDAVRHKMRNVIMQHTEDKMLGDVQHDLQTVLFDEFATLNRDWRRIAVTESGNNQLNGFVASVPEGSKLKRVEQYQNACAFCRSIDGKIVDVVSPDKPDKDGDTEVWVGKDNIGRSASPKKRVGNVLVDRLPDERFWIPAGTAHPSCRGQWVKTVDVGYGDPEFAKWLQDVLK